MLCLFLDVILFTVSSKWDFSTQIRKFFIFLLMYSFVYYIRFFFPHFSWTNISVHYFRCAFLNLLNMLFFNQSDKHSLFEYKVVQCFYQQVETVWCLDSLFIYLLVSLITGLSKRTTTEGLRDAFQKFGEVVSGMCIFFFLPIRFSL